MPIIRFFNSRNHNDKKLIACVDYIANPEKTKGLVFSQGISAIQPAQDIIATQRLFHKDRGRRYIHFIVAYKDSIALKQHLAHSIGKEICSVCLPEYQVFMGTHSNTPHIHNHFLVSTVNCATGKKWQMSQGQLKELKEHILSIVQSHGQEILSIRSSYGDSLEDVLISADLFEDNDPETEVSKKEPQENGGHYVTSFFGTEYISKAEVEAFESIAERENIKNFYNTGNESYLEKLPCNYPESLICLYLDEIDRQHNDEIHSHESENL